MGVKILIKVSIKNLRELRLGNNFPIKSTV